MIKIKIISLPDTYSKRCDFCERELKTYKTLKLVIIGQGRYKMCNACLKILHNIIHRACHLSLIHTTVVVP